ncbi:MAG: hypothetical protein A3G76_00535 [Acidobacteria bacterium RIFCSPLOWO2_12_FULL_65_11]|nr:MAG: hypothetical protein A3H95_06930 [Acidobacteria bacterium RIFCSPLOWO2_02_FULL_64_15]OFW34149.1 MAG: hypothetical protein A3G76_00535 [Acidobacteria bacterium RIFCSPLOWO2_12_FULL_65_11]
MELLAALENSAFGAWVRESPSPWAYPGVLFLHTVGLSFLVGLSVAIDLRLLGAARRLPVPPLARFYPVMWMGFGLNALSGVALFAANATTRATNPAFYFKMGFVTLAMIALLMIRRSVVRQSTLGAGLGTLSDRVLAVASLVCWTGVITSGRLMAYFGQG